MQAELLYKEKTPYSQFGCLALKKECSNLKCSNVVMQELKINIWKMYYLFELKPINEETI
jgi:hypothetical protein